jgi:hypothetical protein
MNKLASIQRRAALMITGAMKMTATDVVEVMANCKGNLTINANIARCLQGKTKVNYV